MAKNTKTETTKIETATEVKHEPKILPDLSVPTATETAPTEVVVGNLAVKVEPQASPASTFPTFDQAKLDSLTGKNAKVRYLTAQGFTKGQIVKFSKTYAPLKYEDGREIRFQHVRNILITPVKNPKA